MLLHETGDSTIYVAVSAVVGCFFVDCVDIDFVVVGAKGSTIHVAVLKARPLFLRE